MTESRLKSLLNHGESAVLAIAEAVCEATNTRAFAKIRIADVIRIDRSGIPDDLYHYALSAHFDVLVSRNNAAFLAIEFDGLGHDSGNDQKKAEICDRFHLPLVRVRKAHLDAKVFEDAALAFFIWQLFCVDAFLMQCGNDQYEPYDPAWFVNIPGKDRDWPFAYDVRWRGRLRRPFQEAASTFEPPLRELYFNGLVNLGAVDISWRRGLEFRSICAQLVANDRVVWGEAELDLQVHGLEGRRGELFAEMASFVEGMAAEKMHGHAMRFLAGTADTVPIGFIREKGRQWELEGFLLIRGFSAAHPARNS
jgi:hypothetical protein